MNNKQPAKTSQLLADFLQKHKSFLMPALKPVSEVPWPSQRTKKWVKVRMRICFVICDLKGDPRIRTGTVKEIQHDGTVVVWPDQPPLVGSQMHSLHFTYADPALLRLDEIQPLMDKSTAVAWFKRVYSKKVAQTVSFLLNKRDLGQALECLDIAIRSYKISLVCDLRWHYFRLHKKPAPKSEITKLLAHIQI